MYKDLDPTGLVYFGDRGEPESLNVRLPTLARYEPCHTCIITRSRHKYEDHPEKEVHLSILGDIPNPLSTCGLGLWLGALGCHTYHPGIYT